MNQRTLNDWDHAALLGHYQTVRQFSLKLCVPLTVEDHNLQAMPEVSPAKWHLAHTTWFFETFLLKQHCKKHTPFNEAFEYLFNSYYNGIGQQFPRAQRGLISRPSLQEVLDYRHVIDAAMTAWLSELSDVEMRVLTPLVLLGTHHEQQHQELLLTDVKYCWSKSPLMPVYHEQKSSFENKYVELAWQPIEEFDTHIGADQCAFHFDNESPRFALHQREFKLATRLITNAEYLEFIDDGGYQNPLLWLSDGWATVQSKGWLHPEYWRSQQNGWEEYTLLGLNKLDLHAPVTHVSFFEADAFARWSGTRLPTEFEWEAVAQTSKIEGNFVENDVFHPVATNPESNTITQMFGDTWEWTASPYIAYPGYRPEPGAVGEYNGKFMCNQWVLRGGSCVSSKNHLRASYRNFFYAPDRWQFTGIRLAKD